MWAFNLCVARSEKIWMVLMVQSSAVRWANLSLFWVWWDVITQAHICGILLEWPLWEPVQWTASAHILANGAPCPLFCPFIYHFLSPSHRLSGCVNNESIFGGDCLTADGVKKVTGMHGFHSLSIGPCALNNSLTYHFFSWDWKKAVWWQILPLHHIAWLILK